MTNRRRAMACGLGLVGLCGCQATVSMNNGSDSWLDVRYYVANPPSEEGGAWNFIAIGRQQIKPESSAAYTLTDNPDYSPDGESVVHVLVEPTSPTWEDAAQYWIELLTPAPITIVVTGSADSLEFSTEEGVIRNIPVGTLDGALFQYSVRIVDDDDDDDHDDDDDDHDDDHDDEPAKE
ncbi:MAG: hypothetical protein IH985_08440 [Planctomycetes bacterium]|nr:hypothetical protein [Planctomycetota bacterium]